MQSNSEPTISRADAEALVDSEMAAGPSNLGIVAADNGKFLVRFESLQKRTRWAAAEVLNLTVLARIV